MCDRAGIRFLEPPYHNEVKVYEVDDQGTPTSFDYSLDPVEVYGLSMDECYTCWACGCDFFSWDEVLVHLDLDDDDPCGLVEDKPSGDE